MINLIPACQSFKQIFKNSHISGFIFDAQCRESGFFFFENSWSGIFPVSRGSLLPVGTGIQPGGIAGCCCLEKNGKDPEKDRPLENYFQVDTCFHFFYYNNDMKLEYIFFVLLAFLFFLMIFIRWHIRQNMSEEERREDTRKTFKRAGFNILFRIALGLVLLIIMLLISFFR